MTIQQLILGTAKFSQIRESELAKMSYFLIRHPHFQRIQLDTAFAYQNSELLVSKYFSNSGKELLVDTKIGMSTNQSISLSVLRSQFYESCRRLYPLQIRNIFVHSADPYSLADDVYVFLRNLRDSGLISGVGYSGDGKYLERAIKMGIFDIFMSTFSIIDQSNYCILRGLSAPVTLKRVIGSGVLKNRQYKLMRRRLGTVLGESWAQKRHTYQYRYDAISKEVGFRPSLQDFLDYADWKFPRATKIVGISSLPQLKQILESFREQAGKGRSPELFDAAWESLSHHDWQPIT